MAEKRWSEARELWEGQRYREERAALGQQKKRFGLSDIVIPAKPVLVLLLVAGVAWVGYYRGATYVWLLVCWGASLYGLSYVLSESRAAFEEITLSPLAAIVSVPKTVPGPLSYHRTARLSDKLIESCSITEYNYDKTYYFELGSGLSWFTDDDDNLMSALGVSEEIIEVGGRDMINFSNLCKAYIVHRRLQFAYFAIGWIVVVILTRDAEGVALSIFLLGIAACSTIVLGLGVRRSKLTKPFASESLVNRHFHFFHSAGPESFYCQCGERRTYEEANAAMEGRRIS